MKITVICKDQFPVRFEKKWDMSRVLHLRAMVNFIDLGN